MILDLGMVVFSGSSSRALRGERPDKKSDSPLPMGEDAPLMCPLHRRFGPAL